MDFTLVFGSIPTILAGLPLTLYLVGLSLAVGFVFAVVLALLRLTGNPLLGWPAYLFVYFFRSTPLLVQIFLIYYGLGQFRPDLQALGLWGFFREPFWCAVTALTFNTAAYTAEIIRGGILSVPHGQVEAARAVQRQRYGAGLYCNAHMGPPEIKRHVVLDEESRSMLQYAMEDLKLSARAYDRILKVARTIADLAGSAEVASTHIGEAVQYRSLDREIWGR
ncbi:MAG: ABC transporter permease subunit [Candidatus Competibacteraceae bacterium]|nr:ABC transporter permease subunit [Candidatus Competibacteraceae bacterium]